MTNIISWRFAEKWACQIITFVITIVIARILNPDAYGIVAIVSAFISIFSVFVDSGLGNSLIQKKDITDVDYSTVFYTNLLLCTIIYLLLFFVSPSVEEYYQMEGLSSLLRVSGLSLLIFSLKNVQEAYISKNLQFKKFFFASLFGTIGSGIVGIWMALKGFGAWALVISNLFDVICDTLFLFFLVEWKPKLVFSFKRLRSLYNYGWKIFVSSLINKIYKKSSQLIIGKFYSSSDLAFFDKGDTIAGKITINVDSTINSVLFPVLSINQDNKDDLKKITKNTLKTNFYIMTPLLIGLFIVCKPFISVVLTDKWLPAVDYIRIYCLINILLPFHSTNLNVIKSIGKSGLFLKLEIYKKIIGILFLIFTVKYGPLAIAYGQLITNIICLFINSYSNRKDINYGIFEQIKDILPTVFISTIMALVVNIINYLNIVAIIKLVIEVLLGIIIYVVLSYVLKIDVFINIIKLIKEKKKNA